MISCAKYLHLNPSLNAQTEFISAASFVTPNTKIETKNN